ncbi:laminin subunit alpha-3 isoform X1 [Patella vulgata]|uniref:laminin subunit alpha-3 isoform X1 n=1 Tax=Patella vulgata TaxID=6465 RepID=UPI0024A8BBB2|nr:laminin subunit alpha-3 isoform X1 [Patella vulgata]
MDINSNSKINKSQVKIKMFGCLNIRVIIVIVLLTMFRTCVAPYAECEQNGTFSACHTEPLFLDISKNDNYTIRVDPPEYTCGQTVSNTYFRLGESPITARTCSVGQHPVSAMVDDDEATWWQSITWPIATYDNTNSFEISIILSFNKLYRFADDMTITFNSGRPRKMILEKSMDYGKTWTALQYYARNCANYLSIDGVASQVTKEKLDQVICTTRYSGNVFNPQPGGQVKFAAFNDRLLQLLGAAGTDYKTYYDSIEQSDILNFLSFTDLRIRLIYPATDADETSRSVTKFMNYYYAISNIEITGRCFCNLHGSSCTTSTENGEVKCVCKHFTDGRECERCLPMYNDRPWRAGTYSPYPNGTPNECTKCECNDHATSCMYNSTVGRGVCIDCQHNTTGQHCEECVQGFFPNTTLPLNDTQRCTECSCEVLGVTDTNSSCIQTTNVLGQLPGQCKCKPLVTGRRCDACDPQYYGLLMADSPGTCKMCNCDTDGTVDGSNVCGQTDGQCPCKPSTDDRKCDVCKDGFYQFPRGIPAQGCLSCGCDPGGSVSKACDKATGRCLCKDHITDDKCTIIESNFYVPTVDDFRLEPEGGVASDCTVNEDLWTQEQPFDGTQFAKCPLEKNVTLNFASIVTARKQMDVSWPYYAGIRYSVNTTETILAMLMIEATGASGATVEDIRSLTGVTLPTADYNIPDNSSVEIPLNLTMGISTGVLVTGVTVDIDLRSTYTVSLAIQGIQGSTSYINIDSAILVPALTKMNGSTVVASFRTYEESTNMAATTGLYQRCASKMVGLNTRDATLQETTCSALLRSVGAEINNATNVCGCDPTGTVVGTVCDAVGGQCQCKPGVGGRTCSRCLSGYYNLTIDGCKPCNCVDGGSLNGACDRNNGQCPCKTNVAIDGQIDVTGNSSSKQCSACVQDFYGFGSLEGCSSCSCNSSGSTASQCAADGQCPCKPTIGGKQCDVCQPGYFKFSADGCVMCSCSSEGSSTGSCDITTGACHCKDNVQGDKCDTCKSGYFNLVTTKPKGCQPCFCFRHGSTCSSASGYSPLQLTVTGSESLVPQNGYYSAPPSFLGDRHWSYGQSLTFVIQNNDADINLQNVELVKIENKDISMTYSLNESLILNQTAMTMVVPMYEWNWMYMSNGTQSQATAIEFYRILSNVSKISVKQDVNGTNVFISELMMTTAQKVEGQGTATFVEQCVCNTADDNVAGTSCERCAVGFKRPNSYNDTSYASCVACDCNSRGATTPPVCDEWSGVCLNCRNGTMGDHCESCSANVQEPNCDACMTDFYGLDKDGCKACECDKVGSTGTDCLKDSGNCSCQPNVVGRKCDQCKDNYNQLTTTGCTECDECYKLILTQVDVLRSQRDNLTSEITRLRQNDMNEELGPFTTRIDQTKSDMNKLMAFLTQAGEAETTTQTKISAFKAHTVDASTRIDTTKSTKLVSIQMYLQKGDIKLQEGLDKKDMVDVTVKDTNANIDPISKRLVRLRELMDSLKSAETYLETLSMNTTSGLSDILKSIASLENISSTANAQANQILEDVQISLMGHENNTQQLSSLKSQNDLLKSIGETALSESRDARMTSNITYNTAIRLSADVSAIESFNPDIAALKTRIAEILQKSNGLKPQLTTAQTTLSSKDSEIPVDRTLSSTLLSDTRTLATTVDNMYTKASNALDLAKQAKANELKVFEDAENMLETMRNFDARRAAVESTANDSLQAVNNVKTLSEEVITQAANLRSSLTTAQQDSSLSKEAARQAYTSIQTKLTALTPVAEKASILLTRTNTELTNLEERAQLVGSTNATVGPLATTCEAFTPSITNLQTRAARADEKAQNLTTAGSKTKTRSDQLLLEIQNIGDIDFTADATRLAKLQSDVQAARTAFTALNLTNILTDLKQSLDTQRTWLQTLRTEKADLETQIAYLRRLSSQIR